MAITSRALSIASSWFDEPTVRRTFEPLIADWQREWQEATPSRRRWITLRGLGAFVVAVLVSSPQIVRTAAPADVSNHIATRMAGVVAMLTALLMIRPAFQLWSIWTNGSSWMRGSLFIFTVPQALALAFPLAIVAGVVAIRRHHSLPAHVARAVALKLGVLAALFMLIYGGWVIPAANYASVRAKNPSGMAEPLRGVRELTTTELVFDPASATMFALGTLLPSRSTSIQRELNGRAAVVVLPLVLLWLRWRAYDRPTPGWPLTAWFAIPIVIGVLSTASNVGTWLERDWQFWTGTQQWMPIIVFLVWGLLSAAIRRSRSKTVEAQ